MCKIIQKGIKKETGEKKVLTNFGQLNTILKIKHQNFQEFVERLLDQNID